MSRWIHINQLKLMSILKRLLYPFILVLAINVCEARVYIGIGVGGGYPTYSCVPGYWDNGYWVQGNCDEGDYYNYSNYNDYSSVYTGPAFIWGGFGGGGGHRHGGWSGGGGGGHHHH